VLRTQPAIYDWLLALAHRAEAFAVLCRERPRIETCKKRAIKPASGDRLDVGDRLRVLILRNLLKANCGPENNLFRRSRNRTELVRLTERALLR
jgi:hypothetical protein